MAPGGPGRRRALEHNIDRLQEDHANAARLAAMLAGLSGITVEPVQTNMVFVRISPEKCAALSAHLEASGIKALIGPRTRLCTHLDVDAAGIESAAEAFRSFFA